jgi:DNA-binding response OmpR family regulator
MGLRVASLEDDAAEAARIREIVTAAGHECVTFADGRRMLVTLRKVTFDLLLLDWHVAPDRAEVLDWVRAHLDPRMPVMFLTRRDAEADIVATLSAGADDYMVKPIRPRNSRAHPALLRRAYPDSRQRRWTADLGRNRSFVTRQATRDGALVPLTPKEFELALLMFRNAGRVVPREHMVRRSGAANCRRCRAPSTRMSRACVTSSAVGAQRRAAPAGLHARLPAGTAGRTTVAPPSGSTRRHREKGTRRCLSQTDQTNDQKMWRMPAPKLVWLLRPGSSVVVAPETLLKSAAP